MKTHRAALVVLMVALALPGCGGGGGGRIDDNVARLAGTWEKVQESRDGGVTFQAVPSTSRYQLTLYATGRWSDSAGKHGRFELRNNLMIGTTDGQGDQRTYTYWELHDGNRELWLRHTDSDNLQTGRVSLYRRR